MKKYQLIIISFILAALPAFGQYKTLHDFTARTIDGHTFDFSTLKGKKVLLINTATECALTPQFKKLQELYEEYGGDDFEIIAFPSNDFGSQEPGNNERIQMFCENKYAISFQLMEKISIKENPHPIYKWLTSSKENGTLDGKVIWNFQKFLIDEDGTVVESLSPITGPQNRRIIEWLQE
ncbi:MAG: glutathione peroxidase [Bacteroidota bacterium]